MIPHIAHTTYGKGGNAMRVAIIHASMSGHTETLASAIADGAQHTGAQVGLWRAADVQPEWLTESDAIIWGSSGYFGGPNPLMVSLFERLGGLWLAGALQGKVGGVFATVSSMHGGVESVLHALSTAMMHHGIIVVPNSGPLTPERIRYGCPYGASAIISTAQDMDEGAGQITPAELTLAHSFGTRVAHVAQRMANAHAQYPEYPKM